MKNLLLTIACVVSIFYSTIIAAATGRIPVLANDKVSIWTTTIYSGNKQTLKMHRHEHDRVVVAFSDGLLKITNDHGKVHYWHLKKNKAYYLKKDVPNELHQDENLSAHPVKVMVIELK